MPHTASASLVALLLQVNPEQPPGTHPCEDIERIELSMAPRVNAEVCVSPGLLTGFLFDTPVDVELQDEVRFAELLRGRSSFSLVPPPDMVPGERLRLTARLQGGAQSVTFSLVAHPGRSTRQVEVYRDPRSRASLLQENAQEHAKNQELQEEVERLRAQRTQSGGLRGLLLAGALNDTGIPALELKLGPTQQESDDALSTWRVITYRSLKTVAGEVWLLNSGTTPWRVEGASLTSAAGEILLEGVRVGQAEPIPPQQSRRVFFEADAARGTLRGEVMLRLWGADGRTLTLPKVPLP
ncbi:MAG TPA: DUF2381 family protein [Archangium sp.]|uniref:DUF2381 family protein n=1 Tax=Archangium sp. TaxID=1872627 RepID=UPI002E36CB15|nr:DUF2381 family protein [Archangium sp.]HEX5754045.1 DUF2381 family protein [Archangium sp.]